MTKENWWKLLEEDPYSLPIAADWFEEHNDPLAPTIRWCVEQNRFPHREYVGPWQDHRLSKSHCWTWGREGYSSAVEAQTPNSMCIIDEHLLDLMKTRTHRFGPRYVDFMSLVEAFEELHLALFGDKHDQNRMVEAA